MTPVANAFLKEAPPRQLGALAASLARIASSATKPARTAAIDPMLSECIQFVEWTTPQASSKVAAEIADLRAMLMLWPLALVHDWLNQLGGGNYAKIAPCPMKIRCYANII